MTGYEIAKAYSKGHLSGWAGDTNPGLLRRHFKILNDAGHIQTLKSLPKTGDVKVSLWKMARRLLGKDITNYPQLTGDCGGFGGKNAAEWLQVVQALLLGDKTKYRPVFPSWYYGASRFYVGKNQLGNEQGTYGLWVAVCARDLGTLFSDEKGCPKYSQKIADSWGDQNDGPDLAKYKAIADDFLVQGIARAKTWADLVKSYASGYPVTVASNIAFEMEPRRDGFHHRNPRDKWPHAMSISEVDDNDKDPYAIVQNQWGDVHGHLKELDGDEILPFSSLRVRRADIELMLKANDSYAWSNMKTFKDNSKKLQRELFTIV